MTTTLNLLHQAPETVLITAEMKLKILDLLAFSIKECIDALTEFYSKENPFLFLVNHIFCDSVSNQLKIFEKNQENKKCSYFQTLNPLFYAHERPIYHIDDDMVKVGTKRIFEYLTKKLNVKKLSILNSLRRAGVFELRKPDGQRKFSARYGEYILENYGGEYV